MSVSGWEIGSVQFGGKKVGRKNRYFHERKCEKREQMMLENIKCIWVENESNTDGKDSETVIESELYE